MSRPSMTPLRLAQSTHDWSAIDSYRQSAIDVGDWLRDRAVPEKSKWGIVFIGAASAALWAILLLCAVYAVRLAVVS